MGVSKEVIELCPLAPQRLVQQLPKQFLKPQPRVNLVRAQVRQQEQVGVIESKLETRTTLGEYKIVYKQKKRGKKDPIL